MPPSSGIKVLHKTLDILEVVRAHPGAISLGDLSTRVAMPKPTVYRIVNTLESRGYLGRTTEGAYTLAKKLFRSNSDDPIEQRLNKVALPVMEDLARLSKETVNLGVLDGGEVVVINTVESPQSVRMTSKIGNRRFLHSTALGKVLLAYRTDKEIGRLLRIKGTPRLTEKTLVDQDGILHELENIRLCGYAFDDQENEVEGRCVAAPVMAPDGLVIAAISISGPEFRVSRNGLENLTDQLKRACTTVSASLAL